MRALLASAVLATGFAFSASGYTLTLASFVLLAALVTLGLVLLTGLTGLISFGQAGFAAIGAYAAGYLGAVLGWPAWATLIAGLALVLLSAVLIGALTLSMGGHYLSLATLAWGVVAYYSLGALEPLGGFNGLGGIPALQIAGVSLGSERAMFMLIAAAFGACFALARNLAASRHGRALRAVRLGRTLPEAFGIDPFRVKVAVFCVAAAMAGLSGWLYAYMLRFLNPTPFGLNAGIEYLFMAVIGGATSLWGALAGAGVVVALKQVLQALLPQWLGRSGNFEVVVFGALMLLMLARANAGLMPMIERACRRLRRAPQPSSRRQAEEPAAIAIPAVRAGSKVLSVQGLCKRFGGLVAVEGVSFDVGEREIVALLGPNGAGKSTLFDLISGVLAASGGTVDLLGRRTERLPARRIASLGVARTFQHVKLMGESSVLDNVALGGHLGASAGWLRALLGLNAAEERRIREQAMAQIERCGLAGHEMQATASLALGQQRIVEIARALCARPRLLLLDEPAAGLRHHEKLALAALLQALRGEGMTILIVDHDMDFIGRIADRLVVLQSGRKIADDTAAAVRANPAVRDAYLGALAA